jgi:hypothetical protein
VNWPEAEAPAVGHGVGLAAVAGRWDRSGRWAVLVAWAGGAAFLAALWLPQYTAYQNDADIGPWLVLLAGAAIAAAGIYARLRSTPPPGPR